MPRKQRYLITTADERTWKFDRPVIFLGEWCRIYDRKHIWQGMDSIVAAPYGLSQSKKDADYAEARALEDKLFPVLCDVLNRYHDTKHSLRFWRIVLGHWFSRYVDVMLNRVKTLEQCFQTYEILGITTYSSDNYSLATQDFHTSIWAFNDECWNNTLAVRIIEQLRTVCCSVEYIQGCDSHGFSLEPYTANANLKTKLLKWGRQQVAKLASFLTKNSDAFIINSYLPKKEQIKLHLALGQCPQLWVSCKLEISEKPDSVFRKTLAKQIATNSDNSLEDILSVMALELLPVCYLEGFDTLVNLTKQQSWPKRPKFIFTSNNFYWDEVFKLWAASKTEYDFTKYVVGQHGSLYGTHRHWNYNTIEELTADKFLTWGWSDGLPQHTPAFIFKTAGRKKKYYNPQGGLLLIELHLNHRITTWDDTIEFVNYFEDQKKFVNKLAGPPKQKLNVRLHASYNYLKWCEVPRWQEFDPLLKIDTGSVHITTLIAQSRLVVHSYDSTGMLETLSQNIPTLAFWQNNFDHLRDGAQPYYQLLVDAGIVHLTAESTAQKVNEVWEDVEGWWQQDYVQEARKKFCDRYARDSQNPVQELIKLLQI